MADLIGSATAQVAVSALWGWLTPTVIPGYLAVVVAGFALNFARKSSKASQASAQAAQHNLEIAQKNLARLEEEREKEQAGLFSVWIAGKFPAPKLYGDDFVMLHVAVRNASNGVIYATFVQFDSPYLMITGSPPPLLGGAIQTIPPGRSDPDYYVCLVPERYGSNPVMTIEFIDSTGILWRRDAVGRLSKAGSSRKSSFKEASEATMQVRKIPALTSDFKATCCVSILRVRLYSDLRSCMSKTRSSGGFVSFAPMD